MKKELSSPTTLNLKTRSAGTGELVAMPPFRSDSGIGNNANKGIS